MKSVSNVQKTDYDNMSFQNESEATNLERQSFDPQRESHKEFKALLGNKQYQNDQEHDIDSAPIEELRPSQLIDKKQKHQPELE